MKLRNKKTGEYGDYLISTEGDLLRVCNYYDDDETYLYNSLTEFLKEWKDNVKNYASQYRYAKTEKGKQKKREASKRYYLRKKAKEQE